jgi:hypothetical protein
MFRGFGAYWVCEVTAAEVGGLVEVLTLAVMQALSGLAYVRLIGEYALRRYCFEDLVGVYVAEKAQGEEDGRPGGGREQRNEEEDVNRRLSLAGFRDLLWPGAGPSRAELAVGA